MKNIKAFIAVILSFSLSLTMLCSCAKKLKRDDRDTEEDTKIIQQIAEDVMKSITTDDEDSLRELCDSSSIEIFRGGELRDEDFRAVVVHAVSFAKIIDMEEPEYSDDYLEADMEVKISYLDIKEFSASGRTGIYLEDILASMDEFEPRQEGTVELEFVFDEEEQKWYMDSDSAEDIMDFVTESWGVPIPQPTPTDDQKMALQLSFEEFDPDKFVDDLSVDELFMNDLYDNRYDHGTGTKSEEALRNFVKEYLLYYLDHDYEITYQQGDRFGVKGMAPSSEDLYKALTTDEFQIEYRMYILRYELLGMDFEDMLDEQTALVYNTLAAAVPECEGEEHSISGGVEGVYDRLYFNIPIVKEPDKGVYEAEHGIMLEQLTGVLEEAVTRLYENGEIDETMYTMLINSITPENLGYAPVNTVSSSGHPNQALGVFEQSPSWCTDGSVIYGYSQPDENGFWMFYSKEPDWLDTVAYYIDDDGIWIDNYFDKTFKTGTTLIVDWWIDGEYAINTQEITVADGLNNEIEVYLPTDEFPSTHTYEMRLWEEDHKHVISYVVLEDVD